MIILSTISKLQNKLKNIRQGLFKIRKYAKTKKFICSLRMPLIYTSMYDIKVFHGYPSNSKELE